ncbi:MAG: Ig-like domain-containing protein [SAR324 cluster bacterium]|nr:Ig-like domain-containing protein [SAR324 cluster bacterium]
MKPTHADRGHIPFRVLANYFSISLLALALGVAISACGPSEVGESSAAASDTTQPTSGGTGGDTTPPGILSLLPASGSRIGGTRKIVVTFNESIKPSTLRLRGDLAGESDGGKFSKATFKNDTLTITPITQWAEGDDRTLTFNVKDPKGNALGKAVLTYTVDLTDPVGNVSPESGAIIGGEAPIVITFDGSMRTSLMVLQGDLIDESDGGVWSETTVPKDTLTISPLTAWTEGEERGLTIDGEDLAGNVLETLTLSYTVDTTSPVAGVSPASGSYLQVTDPIVVTFDESMDTASLVLAGDMVAESDGGAWSLAVDENDTLTFTPLTEWTEANGKTLAIDAADIAGNAVTTLSLTYSVDTSAATVSANYPSSGDTIDEDSQIVFIFSESMDTGTGTVTGTLGGGTPVVTWSTTTNANDTATITPMQLGPVPDQSIWTRTMPPATPPARR